MQPNDPHLTSYANKVETQNLLSQASTFLVISDVALVVSDLIDIDSHQGSQDMRERFGLYHMSNRVK